MTRFVGGSSSLSVVVAIGSCGFFVLVVFAAAAAGFWSGVDFFGGSDVFDSLVVLLVSGVAGCWSLAGAGVSRGNGRRVRDDGSVYDTIVFRRLVIRFSGWPVKYQKKQ